MKLKYALFMVLLSLFWAKNKAEEQGQRPGSFIRDLYNNIVESHIDSNLVLSPFSIFASLAMVYLGADGKTAVEMSGNLNLGPEKEKVESAFKGILEKINGEQLKIANKIYVNHDISLKADYTSAVINNFFTTPENLNFSNKDGAVQTINRWVENHTDNKIKDLISADSLDPFTKAALVNAIYFKSPWDQPFLESSTKMGPFWIKEDRNKDVPIMQGQLRGRIAIFEGFKAVEIPFKGKQNFLVILLPEQRTGLRTLEQSMTSPRIIQIKKDMTNSELIVRMPKFRTEFNTALKDALEKMGVKDMFTGTANFSQMTSSPLSIDAFIHKAFIDVDEKGVEAAAATYVGATPASAPLPAVSFDATHPFLYLLVDKDYLVHFMGRVVDP